jgi:hypothetical protein
MPRNGLGTYSLPAGQPVVSGATISASTFNTLTNDLASALTQSLCIDGQAVPTANLNMGGFKLTNAALGTATTDMATLQNFASPPAIGATTPAAGSFTTVAAATMTTTGAAALTSTADQFACVYSLKSCNTTNTRPQLQMNRSRGTLAAPTALATSDILGEWQFFGYTGSSYSQSLSIRCVAESAFTTAPNLQSALQFYTCKTPGSSAISEIGRFSSGGNFLWGTTSTSLTSGNTTIDGTAVLQNGLMRSSASSLATLELNRTTTFGGVATFFGKGVQVGGITVSAAATSFDTSSDYRLKTNVQPFANALETVAQLRPVTYNWRINGERSQGFIAHELAEVVPEAVTGVKDAVAEDGKIIPQGVDYSKLVVFLAAAIQEQQAAIVALEARLAALEPA